MHTRCLIVEYRNRNRAKDCLEILGKANFGEDQVSIVTRADDPELEELGILQEDAAENVGYSRGAGLGALLGGVVSAPLAVGTMIGPFFLVGPLVGVGLGAAIGGVLGKAQKWGVNLEARQEYEQRVQEGSMLMIVSGEDADLRELEQGLVTTEPVSVRRFASAEKEA